MTQQSTTQAAITSAVVAAIGLIVAWVPSFGIYEQIAISAASIVVAGVWALAHGITNHGVALAHKAPAPAVPVNVNLPPQPTITHEEVKS